MITIVTVADKEAPLTIEEADANVKNLADAIENVTTGHDHGGVDSKALQIPGEWTAGLVCGSSGTITLKNAYKKGRSIVEGKKVTLIGYFIVDSVDSPVGSLTLTGLPETCSSGVEYTAAVTVFADKLVNTVDALQGAVMNGTKTILLTGFGAGAIYYLADRIQANTELSISVTYFKD
jgi:hypothetical protein